MIRFLVNSYCHIGADSFFLILHSLREFNCGIGQLFIWLKEKRKRLRKGFILRIPPSRYYAATRDRRILEKERTASI